jgi:signal transduction histidine kinase
VAQARRLSFHTMRARIVVALIALLIVVLVVAGYAISFKADGALQLRAVRTYNDQLYTPTQRLVTALQEERRLSMAFVGSRERDGRDAMAAQRTRTQQAESTFRRLAGGSDVQGDASSTLKSRISTAVSRLATLEAGRASIDAGTSDQNTVESLYTQVIATAFPIYAAMPVNQLADIGDRHREVVAVDRANEVLAQEVSVLAGALAAGSITTDQQRTFEQLVGAQRLLFADAAAALDGTQRSDYDKVAGSEPLGTLRTYENRVIGVSSGSLPVSADAWSQAGTQSVSSVADLESTLVNSMLDKAAADANSMTLNTALIALIGIVFIAFFMTIWLRVAPRHVVHQLDGLRDNALVLANERLPRVVEVLRRGEKVDVEKEAPALEFGPDEFGDVGRAFNAVQSVAVQAAIDQAALRTGINEVFVNLARRSQSLVQRQLTQLDAMERRTSDPEELERLFDIDHLATRMRRHAEDLIILSGSLPGRQWRKPVPMVDVVRGAVGEVEGYARVQILQIQQSALAGRVVADVIHLLAELIENATLFSPPHTTVQVTGEMVSSGYVVEIEDRGLGMTEADLERYNKRLTEPPEFNLSDTRQLGLFVVGRLAERHGIKVHLRMSPYGGTTAIALLPSSLVVGAGDVADAGGVASAEVPAGAEAPVGAGVAAEPPRQQPWPVGGRGRSPLRMAGDEER